MKPLITRTQINDKGFTLIELLVSMAIFSIMAGGMYLVFNNFSKVKEITDRDSKRLAELQRAFSFIHKDLSFIIPRPVKDEYGSQNRMNSLVSDGDKIEFTRSGWNSPPFLARKRSELQRVAYVLEEGRLKRNYWYVLDRDGSTESRGMDILSEVEELSFNFFYIEGSNLEEIQQWPPVSTQNTANVTNLQGCNIASINEIRLPEIVEIKLKTEDYGEIGRKFSTLSGYGDALIDVGC